MPFQSQAQARFMFVKHPQIAKRWEDMTPSIKALPQHKKKIMKKHPGFKKVQKKIAQKYGMKAAGAILAHATRNASPATKQANPRLNRVKGNAFDRARAYLKRVKGR